jgi:hypothetical protein
MRISKEDIKRLKEMVDNPPNPCIHAHGSQCKAKTCIIFRIKTSNKKYSNMCNSKYNEERAALAKRILTSIGITNDK